ncbi:DUF445 domain-containing protein [Priestia taiwanensis]|uniref:UPF0754 membrane protein n=1 Tax=Priestia taiwanensis TaxID=1347902 RepID=A0A917EQF8_9BACI|nr:DUF445 family protein [Priestia taiwanensis]MBM7364259.1 uncharacterized membrane protein YheB (UPF0754 family) [Priestia taiwanensis]GGE72975.1 UPF0754 membrane protein [Priestia taiwanensis]
MNALMQILFTVGLGAAIGGYTNSLAIKMLFRPYEPKYIGKFRIPFTPGLIPRRRAELAEQMGKMVVDHLLTKDAIEAKLMQPALKEKIVMFVQVELMKWFESEKSVKEVMDKLGIDYLSVDNQLNRFIQQTIQRYFYTNSHMKVGEIIPSEWQENVEKKIPEVAEYILLKAQTYFASEEGKQRLTKMANDFLLNKGMLGGFAQMLLGNVDLGEKLQPELMKFLMHDGTRQTVTSVLMKEYENVKQWDMKKVEEYVQADAIASTISSFVKKNVTAPLWDKQLNELVASYKEPIKEKIPVLVDKVLQYAHRHIHEVLGALQVEQLVKEQVDSFPTARLEEMLLGITRKELKMITYLGALLGGAIGLVQGIVLLLIS